MSGALSNIYQTVSYALCKHSAELIRLQEQASTGAKINRISDDPSESYKILSLESQNNSLEGYLQNLTEVMDTLEISSTVLEDMISKLAELKSNLTQITGGIYDEAGKQIMGIR